ncbi:MAG: hypothetical protein ACT4TC_15420, partial [Myxococcaceae bacterium]
NRVGMGLTFGGALLAGLGYLALPQVNKQTPMINYGVSLGGVAAVATGIYLWIFGNRRVDPEVHPVNDWRRAQEAAEAYNGSREGRNAKSDLPPPARI